MNNTPARLYKKNEDKNMKIGEWLLAHANIILPILIIVLIILIIGLCLSIMSMGGTNMTMMDSGNYYYHLKDVI